MALACSLLAGHPQTAMYAVYVVLAYGLFRAWSTSSREPELPAFRRYLRMAYLVLLPLVLGVALAAIQLVPTLGFIGRSTRAGLDYAGVAWGFPLAEMTHLLYPGFFGGSPQYVGILPLILAASALFVKRARREVAFWIEDIDGNYIETLLSPKRRGPRDGKKRRERSPRALILDARGASPHGGVGGVWRIRTGYISPRRTTRCRTP